MNQEENVTNGSSRESRVLNWFRQRCSTSGVTEEALRDFENATRISVPSELRNFLRVCNGCNVAPGGFYGIGTRDRKLSIQSMYHLFPSWRDRKWLPLASDGCGDYFVMSLGEREVRPILFVDQENYEKAAYVVASDLWHWLVFLTENENLPEGQKYWPFNEDKVLKMDPAMLNCREAPLPWSAD